MLCKYLSPLPPESYSMSDSIDSLTSQVEALSQSIHDSVSSVDEKVINWARLVERGMDEHILKEITPMFLSDKKM